MPVTLAFTVTKFGNFAPGKIGKSAREIAKMPVTSLKNELVTSKKCVTGKITHCSRSVTLPFNFPYNLSWLLSSFITLNAPLIELSALL